jgi:phosphatidylserine/phosphatidylglycerophosphate/cardiolipin synthase-like enzyme
VVRQRNSITLANWSAYQTATAIPATPDDAWVRVRVLAEAIPLAQDTYVVQTLTYFVQDPDTTTNILQFISQDNDDATEAALATQNDAIMSSFAQRYADSVINQAQVDAWRTRTNNPAAHKPA